MKILNKNVDKRLLSGSITMSPVNIDDFYVLNDLVQVGDVAEGTTTRKLSLDGGRTQQKITLRLAIKVEKADYDFEGGLMSIKGKICKENKHVQLGVYHTVHVEMNESFTLSKTVWSRNHMNLLEESAKDVQDLCFVIFYERECVVSMHSTNNIKNVLKSEIKNKNFKPIITKIKDAKNTVKTIVIAGFGTIVDEFYKGLIKEDKSFVKFGGPIKLSNNYKNLSNVQVINKFITDKSYSSLFAEIKYVEDLIEAKNFFEYFEKEFTKVSVGLVEVLEACEYGAVKKVFITDEVYRPKDLASKKKIKMLLDLAIKIRAKICIVPITHDLGLRLSKMGGITGMLLFNYK